MTSICELDFKLPLRYFQDMTPYRCDHLLDDRQFFKLATVFNVVGHNGPFQWLGTV